MAQNIENELAWRQLVDKALKGASFDDILTTRTADGFRLAPLYPRLPDSAPIQGRAPGKPWAIIQRIDHNDPSANVSFLRDETEGGSNGAVLVADKSPFARGFGLSADSSPGALKAVIEQHPHPELRFDAGVDTVTLARHFGEIEHGTVHYGYDPAGIFAATGHLHDGWDDDVLTLFSHRQRGTALTADGRIYHEASASPALELAATLAAAVFYLRHLERAGIALEEARHGIGFTLAADQDFFGTLAKFRALRLLWQNVENACQLGPHPVHIHAESAWRMQSRRDPATNILRNAIATAAAGLGGADSISTLAFTLVCGLPDAHARRMARNCQHVLISEANLHRTADPATGSGGIEAITKALCQSAWEHFQTIEREGGIMRVLRSGWLQSTINATERQGGTMIGVNAYTLAQETPPSVLRPAPQDRQAPPPALCRQRDAAPCEAIS